MGDVDARQVQPGLLDAPDEPVRLAVRIDDHGVAAHMQQVAVGLLRAGVV